jgi:hypothetical protein
MSKDKYYYKDGTTSSEWDYNKILHRTDGPATEWASGHKEWYVDGEKYIKQEFNKLIEEVNSMNISTKLIDPRWWVRELEEKEVG